MLSTINGVKGRVPKDSGKGCWAYLPSIRQVSVESKGIHPVDSFWISKEGVLYPRFRIYRQHALATEAEYWEDRNEIIVTDYMYHRRKSQSVPDDKPIITENLDRITDDALKFMWYCLDSDKGPLEVTAAKGIESIRRVSCLPFPESDKVYTTFRNVSLLGNSSGVHLTRKGSQIQEGWLASETIPWKEVVVSNIGEIRLTAEVDGSLYLTSTLGFADRETISMATKREDLNDFYLTTAN